MCAPAAFGALVMTLVTLVGFGFEVNLSVAAFAHLMVIVACAKAGATFSCSTILCLYSVGLLYWFFVEPHFTLKIDDPHEALEISGFVTAALFCSWVICKGRQAAGMTAMPPGLAFAGLLPGGRISDQITPPPAWSALL